MIGAGARTRQGASGSESARAALLPFLVTRAIVLGALAVAHFAVSELHATGSAGARESGTVHAGLLSWDATWYERVAEVGYAGAGKPALRFFPLYPLLGRWLGGVPGISDGVALVVIANVLGFGALVLLYLLVSREEVGTSTAERSIWVLSLWPAAFVLVMGYSESLLLCLSIAAFLCWRTGRPGWSILPSYLAGLSRPDGMLLAIPALVEAVLWWRSTQRHAPSSVASRIGSVLAAPAGAFTFLAWAGPPFSRRFTEPLREQLEPAHRGGFADPFQTLAHDLADLVSVHHLGIAVHGPFAIAFVALTVYMFFRLPASYGWYAAATMVVALTAPNLTSLERYGLACFPLSVAVGCLIENRLARDTVMACMGAVLLAFAVLAFLGLYVP